MHTEILSTEHPSAIHHAVDVLKHGGLVAFPTDTVYGLAATPFEAEKVEQLYTAKGRSNEKAIAILVGETSQLSLIAINMEKEAKILAERFWPGPLTLITTRNPALPQNLSPQATIGIRMPNHPVALGILRHIGPLAVTSANRSGQANAVTAKEVLKQLKDRIHLILDGGTTPGGVPSTVVDCTGKQLAILREGPVSQAAIHTALSII